MAETCKNIQFAFWGRVIGCIEGIALPAVAFYNLFTSFADTQMFALASYSICIGILCALIEWVGMG